MEPKTRSRVWKSVGWTVALVIAVLSLVGVVVAGLLVWIGVGIFANLFQGFQSDTEVTIRSEVVNGQIEFNLKYGQDVRAMYQFVVKDADGTELWKLSNRGADEFPTTIVYGVLPDPADKWDQTFPTNGQPLANIRGKHITFEAHGSIRNAFGTGGQITRAEFDIPK